MDKRFFNSVAGFMGATVVVGTITNLLVTVYSSGGDFVKAISFCIPQSGSCSSYYVFWGTIFIATLICLFALIGNTIWWKNVKLRIKVQASIGNPDEKAIITIANENNLDFEFNIYPLKIKILTFRSSLNTLFKEDMDAYSFVVDTPKIRATGKSLVTVAEVYKHEKIAFPVINFLIGKRGYIVKDYFPYIVTDENSSDSEKWLLVLDVK